MGKYEAVPQRVMEFAMAACIRKS